MIEFYKDKTVLITGHTGFKGSWLSEILLEAGAHVIGYSLTPPTNPSLFNICDLGHRMVSITGDIRDFEHLNDTLKTYQPEIVFHLAAQPLVLDGYRRPRYTYDVNVMGTVNILESIRGNPEIKSFLNVTTDKVYENKDYVGHRFKEDEKLDGFDPYSNSKSCSELITHSYKKCFFQNSETAVSTARAGNVIGGGDFSANRIIPDCIRAVEANEPIVVRNKKSTRPYQFVLEPLFVYLLIAQKQYLDHSFSGFYNVGPDENDAMTTGDLVSLFCKKWGPSASWNDITLPNAPHEAGYLALDSSLLRNTFGWHPVMNIDEAVERVVEWTKAYEQDNQMAVAVMNAQINAFERRFCK